MITKEDIIAWNGNTEEGLAEYIEWLLKDPKNIETAKEEISDYN